MAGYVPSAPGPCQSAEGRDRSKTDNPRRRRATTTLRILTRYVLRQLVAPFMFAAVLLTALMMLVVSPYGRTVEGSEWINELLWEALAVQPQASIDSLATLPTDIRKTVMAEVYTAPVHDGFDFPAILGSLERIKVPPGFGTEISSILDTLRPLAR